MTAEDGAGRSATGVGQGYFTEFLKVGANATAAKMLPGTAVEFDTNTYSVKEFDGTGDVVGVLGYETAPIPYKPTNRSTAYAVGDIVPVEIGPCRLRLRLGKSQTITKGEPVKFVADGLVETATIGTDDVCGNADEAVTTDANTVSPIWVIMRR